MCADASSSSMGLSIRPFRLPVSSSFASARHVLYTAHTSCVPVVLRRRLSIPARLWDGDTMNDYRILLRSVPERPHSYRSSPFGHFYHLRFSLPVAFTPIVPFYPKGLYTTIAFVATYTRRHSFLHPLTQSDAHIHFLFILDTHIGSKRHPQNHICATYKRNTQYSLVATVVACVTHSTLREGQ